MTLEKREKEGEKMLGYALSSLNENHMQESGAKKNRGRRGEEEEGTESVTKASL